MKCHALAEELGKIGTGGVLLVLGEAQGLRARDARGDVARDFLRFLAVRREDEDGAEVVAQRPRDAANPVAGDGVVHVARRSIDLDFVERHGALALLDGA